MKIRINKCSNPKLWYFKYDLPLYLEVEDVKNLYKVISPIECATNFVFKDDCEVLSDTYVVSNTTCTDDKCSLVYPNLFEKQNECGKVSGNVLQDGNKRVFESGAVRNIDTNKVNFVESLSFLALKRYATYMRSKQDQMGEGNWKKGIPIKEYEKSLLRHLNQYFGNKYEDMNDEPDCDHLSAAFFNLQGLIHEIEKLNIK